MSRRDIRDAVSALSVFVMVAFLALMSGVAAAAGTVPRVGVLATGVPKTHGVVVEQLRRGLQDLGYKEGRDIVIETRYAMRKTELLGKLTRELLALKVDVIVLTGATAAREAQKVSRSIPIVVAAAGDLVASGIVASLPRPGGNTTGNTAHSANLGAKRLQLLKETMPSLKRVVVIYDGSTAGSRLVAEAARMRAAGLALGVEIRDISVGNQGEIDRAFKIAADVGVDALIPLVSRVTSNYRTRIIGLATRRKIPMLCWTKSLARAGCFMSYGADRKAMYYRAARFVHRILMGAKPADLPIEQPTKFELVVNLRIGRALGIAIPPAILLRADEVIR